MAFMVGGPFSLWTVKADQKASSQDHVAWVSETLVRMHTIKAGMTRNDLLKVFTTEGGIYTRLQRKFVSRDCPYFKVDVEFSAVGSLNRDRDGRPAFEEDPRDVILKISKPYLEFSVMD